MKAKKVDVEGRGYTMFNQHKTILIKHGISRNWYRDSKSGYATPLYHRLIANLPRAN